MAIHATVIIVTNHIIWKEGIHLHMHSVWAKYDILSYISVIEIICLRRGIAIFGLPRKLVRKNWII